MVESNGDDDDVNDNDELTMEYLCNNTRKKETSHEKEEKHEERGKEEKVVSWASLETASSMHTPNDFSLFQGYQVSGKR